MQKNKIQIKKEPLKLGDNQGFQWGNLIPIQRQQFRNQRNLMFVPFRNNFQNEVVPLKKYAKKKISKQDFYVLKEYHRHTQPFNVHSQLRYNLQSTNFHNIYYIRRDGIGQYCTLRKEGSIYQIDNEPEQDQPCAFSTCISIDNNILGLAHLNGKITIFDLNRNYQIYKDFISENQEDHIINHIKIYNNGKNAITSSNDFNIKIMDIEYLKNIQTFRRGSCVNQVCFNKQLNMLGCQLDQTAAEIIDPKSGKIICYLEGHQDFGFSLDWHPNNMY